MTAMFSPAEFLAAKIAIIALVLTALAQTRVHEFYPNADLIIRIRKGSILPNVEIQDRIPSVN